MTVLPELAQHQLVVARSAIDALRSKVALVMCEGAELATLAVAALIEFAPLGDHAPARVLLVGVPRATHALQNANYTANEAA